MKYKCNQENKIIYKIHHRLKRNRFTKKKKHLRSQMLPFASLCLPDNIIPIPEAGIKNLQSSFILISTLCASLLTSLPQSTCLIKLNPEFRVIFIRGVTFWLQKIKKTKPITTTTTTTPRCRLYPTVVTNEGDPYNFYLYPRLKHKT